MPFIVGRVEITCAECRTRLVCVVHPPLDIVVCPLELSFDHYNRMNGETV